MWFVKPGGNNASFSTPSLTGYLVFDLDELGISFLSFPIVEDGTSLASVTVGHGRNSEPRHLVIGKGFRHFFGPPLIFDHDKKLMPDSLGRLNIACVVCLSPIGAADFNNQTSM